MVETINEDIMNNSTSSNLSIDEGIVNRNESDQNNEIYNYVNKIFADQSMLIKSIESFLTDQIRANEARVNSKLMEIDSLVAEINNRLTALESVSSLAKNSLDDLYSQYRQLFHGRLPLAVTRRRRHCRPM